MTTWHLCFTDDLTQGLAADDLPIALAMTAADGRIVQTNAALRDLLGASLPHGPDGLAGMLLTAGVAEPRTLLAASRTACQDLVLRQGGHSRPMRLLSRALPDGCVVHLFHDLHDGEASRARQAELQSLIAHDLRSPLAVIQGYAGLLATGQPGPLNSTQSEFLAGIDTKVVELTRLLNDFLDLSRLEAGALALQLETVALDEVVAQVCEELGPMASARGIALSARAEPEDLDLIADPVRLKQVIENLLRNAVKDNVEGGWVRVEAEIVGGDIAIRIEDGGPGLAADEIAVVFEPFTRGRAGGEVAARGLGLTVAERLVTLHGGTIVVTSGPCGGTTFVVRLPRR